MAEQRKRLDLQPNEPKILELRSEAIVGKNTYGDYQLFIVSNGSNEELSFFSPNEKVYQQLKQLKKGTKFEITKTAKANGKRINVDFEVILLEEKKREPIAEQSVPVAQDDYYFNCMERAFEDALRIQTRFNGMANVNQLAVTIYISRLKQNNTFNGGG